MKFRIIYLVLACWVWTLQAQDPYPLVYAKRQFLPLDKNGNDLLEKSEAKNRWEKFKAYDANNDEVLSLNEYAKIDIPYLETPGEQKLNINYKSTPEEDLYLDIYYPSQSAENKAYPVLIYTHGGGWFNGSKENCTKGLFKETFEMLIEQGFAVVTVNYRLTRYKTVVMKDCVTDVMDAVRCLSKNKSNLGLNVDRVFVLGDSAGGQLAQMLTLADPSKFPGDKDLYQYRYKMVAGVSWYGPSDFTQIELFETDDPSKNPDRFYGRIMRSETDPAQKNIWFKEMSPVYYLTENSAPLFMMAAEDDTTIPVAHAYRMKKKADEIGAPVELFIAKNAGHNWRNVGGEIEPSRDVIVQKTVDFFLKNK